jgi:DNA-binding transcriptional ArsR family regulator
MTIDGNGPGPYIGGVHARARLQPGGDAKPHLSNASRELVAARFRALGDPLRLRILESLFGGALSVGEVVDRTEAAQANVSRHLGLLHAAGLVSRRREGTRILYALTDPMVRKLCTIVCEAVERDSHEQVRRLAEG